MSRIVDVNQVRPNDYSPNDLFVLVNHEGQYQIVRRTDWQIDECIAIRYEKYPDTIFVDNLDVLPVVELLFAAYDG